MDYAQMKQEKDARYEEYCQKYANQLQLLGYITSLEKDNADITEAVKNSTVGREIRRSKKLIKINNKDIEKYKKALSFMEEIPPFK